MSSLKTPVKILIIGNDETEDDKISSLIYENYTDVEIFGTNNPNLNGLQISDEFTADVLVVKDSESGSNSIEYLKQLPRGVEKKVVYITENEENAMDAIKLGIRDFVLDRKNQTGLKSAIDHVVAQIPVSPELKAKYSTKLLINKIDKAVILDTENIIMLESEGPYTSIHTKDGNEIKSSKPLGYYSNILSDTITFIKVNRSISLNFDHIIEVEKNDNNNGTVVLSNGRRIEISANMKNRLLQRITTLLNAHSRV